MLLDFSQPAFCGFASDYVVYLQDEFPKTPIVLSAIGVESHLPQLSHQQLERRYLLCGAFIIIKPLGSVLNECLALQTLHSTDLLLPLYSAPSASHFELPHYQVRLLLANLHFLTLCRSRIAASRHRVCSHSALRPFSLLSGTIAAPICA